MDRNKLKQIARSAMMAIVPLVAETIRQRLGDSNQAAVLAEKRLARKDLLESEAFKNALPFAQERMLRSLDN